MAVIDRNRVEAFKSALLNTCVRIANAADPELFLRLSTCKSNKDFCRGAYRCLNLPYFQPPVEPAMQTALVELQSELYRLGA